MSTVILDNDIPPLWSRMPAAFAYGFKPVPLILALIMSVAIYFAGIPLFGIFILIASLVLPYKYSFSILEYTAEGILDPPRASYEILANQYEVPFKQLGIFILFIIILYVVDNIAGHLVATLFFYAGLVLIPASIMVMGLTHSFAAAMNPAKLINMVFRTGWSYLILVGLLFMLGMAESNLQYFVFDNYAGMVLPFIIRFISIYFTFVAFHIMGYLLYQFHKEIGDSDASLKVIETEHQNSGISDLFDSLMNEGKTEAALMEFQSVVNQYPEDMDLRRRYHNLMLTEGSSNQLVLHAQRYISRLLNTGDASTATDVFLDCIEQGKSCELSKDRDYLAIVKNLRIKGKTTEALKLVGTFGKRSPNSPLAPQLFFLAAQILSEDMHQDGRAKNILDVTLKKYPQHELVAKIQEYRSILDKL